MRKRVKLTFPQNLIKEPVIFTMAKEFNVMPNIRRARVTETVGEMILELEGAEGDLEKGVQWLREKGIDVELVEGDVLEQLRNLSSVRAELLQKERQKPDVLATTSAGLCSVLGRRDPYRPGCFRPGESVVCALTGNGLKDADTVFRVLKEPPWIEAAVLAVENGIKEIL